MSKTNDILEVIVTPKVEKVSYVYTFTDSLGVKVTVEGLGSLDEVRKNVDKKFKNLSNKVWRLNKKPIKFVL